MQAQLVAERWEAAVVSARSLQQFGRQWVRWGEEVAFVVGRVEHNEARLRHERG